uniref:Uncharacterized protein n=1 Tax=Sphaerodactylus townsendi TaxID=933632 RepID=A0ACB8F6I5_9SAUR
MSPDGRGTFKPLSSGPGPKRGSCSLPQTPAIETPEGTRGKEEGRPLEGRVCPRPPNLEPILSERGVQVRKEPKWPTTCLSQQERVSEEYVKCQHSKEKCPVSPCFLPRSGPSGAKPIQASQHRACVSSTQLPTD